MSNEVEEAYKYCKNVTKTHAKSFYFAAKFLPPLKQQAVYPIYAFCRNVDDEIDEAETINQGDAVRSVERWKVGLEEIYSQLNTDESRAKDQRPKTKN